MKSSQQPQERCVAVVSDGKPGHLNQSLGLAEALQRQRAGIRVVEIQALTRGQALRRLLWPARSDEHCDLLIGAGHGTHLSLLALRRAHRCPAVVLMRPSLPGFLFDLRIEPRHDGGCESANCWVSDGPLNRMQPGASRTEVGLILLGGPSPHFAWDDAAVLGQVAAVCDGSQSWQLTSSRRTPPATLEQLRALELPGLQIHDAAALPAGWLATQLPGAARCWVTPDSASMLYEALSAGCAVGVFDLPAQSGSRVAAAVSDLMQRNLVTGFRAVAAGETLPSPREPLAEADRIARRMIEAGWL